MKKLILILLFFFTVSCDEDKAKNYKITYSIHYPNTVKTKSFTCYCFDIIPYSNRGSNSIRYRIGESFGSHHAFVEDTSAPIEIISIIELK